MPVIRVDEEVWVWLQSHARPFEDSPNSVLRRVAGLDTREAKRTGQMHTENPNEPQGAKDVFPATARRLGQRITGTSVNRDHKLNAKHALYHKDGTFYERLTDFPGVLCDSRGYVRYDSAHQFEKDSRLNIGRKVNVPGGLNSHPRYQRYA